MPQRTPYAGRHRGRHRQVVERPSRGIALPGAAAAALTLTATGAAVVPGLNATASATEANPTPDASPRTASSPVAARDHVADVRAELRAAEIAEAAAEARAQARQRASRAAERKRVEQKKREALAAAQAWVSPVRTYRLSSPYGFRWGRLHAGNDFAAAIGTRIGAISSGTVVFAGPQGSYGNKVEIRHWDGSVSYYAHMSSIAVSVGERVTPGSKIGEVGNTGRSTGPHLHLEIHPDGGEPVNPRPWLAERGVDV